ncbi:hypothetical protein LTS07_011434 [Exophiala sideris]|nr:hypothetical protein LTS07_011434 [Exophiala sideris]
MAGSDTTGEVEVDAWPTVENVLTRSGNVTLSAPGEPRPSTCEALQTRDDPPQGRTAGAQSIDLAPRVSPTPEDGFSTASGDSPSEVIPFDEEDGVVRLRLNSMDQMKDFPRLLRRARELAAEEEGTFKIALPNDFPRIGVADEHREDRSSTFRAVSQNNGVYRLDRFEGRRMIQMNTSTCDDTVVDELVQRFEDNLTRPGGLRNVRYGIDLDARSLEERQHIGIPAQSPVWPLGNNQLDRTRAVIPGLHWPFAYKSHTSFGAPFALHKEDCDLVAANVLYLGRKIWTVTAPRDADRLEAQVRGSQGHKFTCSQGVRHCSIYISHATLAQWDVSYKTFSQTANEVVVVYPHSYHQGFSTGSTLAEAVNYAPEGWNIRGHNECLSSCPGYPIPNAKREFRPDGMAQEEDLSGGQPSVRRYFGTETMVGKVFSDQAGPMGLQVLQRHGSSEKESQEEQHEQHEQQQQQQQQQEEEEEEDEEIIRERTISPISTIKSTTASNMKGTQSTKRSRIDIPSETPSKRLKKRGSTQQQASPSQSRSKKKEVIPVESYWDEWDAKRESELQPGDTNRQTIKAVRVWRRLSSHTPAPSPDRHQGALSRDRVDSVVKMVLAVANNYAFSALKEVIFFLQQDGATSVAGIFSSDLGTLVRSIDAIVTADHLNSYLRRFALARLAKSYNDTVVNGGHLVDSEPNMSSLKRMTTKESKSEAYISLIQHTWGVEFPGRYRGQRKTQSGLIKSDASNAVRWNQCRRKLGKQIDAGQRWLRFAERFGWSSLGLISRDWSIGDNKVAASDRIFEENLTSSEHGLLLNEIEALKGRFLRQLNKPLGGGLFDLLEDSSRAKGLPLLGMNHEDILTRPDCDQRWLNEMDCQRGPLVAE